MTQWTPAVGSIKWRDSGHAEYPVDRFTSAKFERGKFLTGTATITAPYDADWVVDYFAAGADPLGRAIVLYYRNNTTPWWIGAPVKVAKTWSRDRNAGEITLTFEHLFQHLFRRILLQAGDNGNAKCATLAQNVDVLGQRLMNDAIGLNYAGGGVFSTAPPYSGYTVDRAAPGQFTPWTVAVAALHSPALSATSVSADMQSGRNMLDALLDLAESQDIAYTMTESPAGTFTMDTTGTYQNNDKTGSVVLTDQRANIDSYSYELDYTGVANTWFMKGDGAGASQTMVVYQDANALTLGIWEDTATLADVTATTSIAYSKDVAFARYSEATTAISVNLIEQAGALSRLGADFDIRDKVKFYSPTFGITSDVLVVGASVDITASGEVRVGLSLNSKPRRIGYDLAQSIPLPGGRHGGGLWSNRSG